MCVRWIRHVDRLSLTTGVLAFSHPVHDLVRAAGVVATPQYEAHQQYSAYPRPIEALQQSVYSDSHRSYGPQPSTAPSPPPSLSHPPTPMRPESAFSGTSSHPSALFAPPFVPSAPPPTYATPPTGPATASPPPAPDFSPLVAALQSRPAHPLPLRSLIGGLVTQIQKDAFQRAGTTSAREYFEAGKRAGVVEMGAGDVMGQDWSECSYQPGGSVR